MQFMGITYARLDDIEDIAIGHRVVWADFVIDTRTVKANTLKKFAEKFELWGHFQKMPGPKSDAVVSFGTLRDDTTSGGATNDFMVGRDGNDHIMGGDGNDYLMGQRGDDVLDVGDGFFNRAKGGTGDDQIIGGTGIEWVHGNGGKDHISLGAGNDKGYGGSGRDHLEGGDGNDWLQGAKGRDTLDGGAGDDTLHGGNGADHLTDKLGRDWLDGGRGRDVLEVVSDAGTPDEKLSDVDFDNLETATWTDRVTGGRGADEFRFVYEMNTTDEIAARNLNPDGTVNWMMVMRENANPHDHWVDWGGFDRIDDFSHRQGDHIVIEGHTVGVVLTDIDLDGNGQVDSTVITVFSDQAKQMEMMGMGGMPMAHDQDLLGHILVEDALIDMDDITLDAMSMAAAFDTL